MEFRLQFNMDNAAFTDNPEIPARDILRGVAGEVMEGKTDGTITDYNGNSIGRWEIEVD